MLVIAFSHLDSAKLVPDIVATKFPDTKVVQVDWLLDSIESDDKLDEAPYLFQLKAIPTPVPEDDVKTQVKKKMATNKRKSDEAATPALKKAKLQEDQKDRQIANSRSLLVPVDQGCPLAGTLSLCWSQLSEF